MIVMVFVVCQCVHGHKISHFSIFVWQYSNQAPFLTQSFVLANGSFFKAFRSWCCYSSLRSIRCVHAIACTCCANTSPATHPFAAQILWLIVGVTARLITNSVLSSTFIAAFLVGWRALTQFYLQIPRSCRSWHRRLKSTPGYFFRSVVRSNIFSLHANVPPRGLSHRQKKRLPSLLRTRSCRPLDNAPVQHYPDCYKQHDAGCYKQHVARDCGGATLG